jgi:hypothetical protein
LKQKLFLKEEQVILLKNSVFALENLCKEYFFKFPDRTLIPGLVSQSPLECLFGILKKGSQKLNHAGYKSRMKGLRSRKSSRIDHRGKGNDEK